MILWGIVACTPYDSNKVNNELIQGKWQLIDVDHEVYDTIAVDYSRELTYLAFVGDTCTQYMPDLRDTLMWAFTIHDYRLILLKDSSSIIRFEIDSLTDRTLVLSHDASEHIYRKVE